MTTGTIRIKTTDDAVRHITRLAIKTIAADTLPGHSAQEVRARMEADDVQAAIRRSYTRNLERGLSVLDAFTRTGQALIAHYCEAAGIPAQG